MNPKTFSGALLGFSNLLPWRGVNDELPCSLAKLDFGGVGTLSIQCQGGFLNVQKNLGLRKKIKIEKKRGGCKI